MRAWVELQDRAERNVVVRETLNAVRDGLYWGWALWLVAAVVVWVARGLPDPATAAAAAVLAALGSVLAWWRTWRRTATSTSSARATAPEERRAAAATSARRWLGTYGAAAVLIPVVLAAADRPGLGVVLAVVVVAALAELAILTIGVRARWRLLARLRIGARAVAGDDDVDVGRALWQDMHLARVMVSYPPHWAAHRDTRREDLVERMMWELVGPPPRTPAEAAARPDYMAAFDHVECRLVVSRVPALPSYLAARDWRQPAGAIVLGQTGADVADGTPGGVPVALYRPRNHALIVGGTQHGKSSGVRAWVIDGLTHNAFPGGVWCVDGKGSGSMAPLIGRTGVHAVAHHPDEWRRVIVELVVPEVRRRYEEILDWRAGRSATKPDHPRGLVVLDELQQVLMTCPDLAEPLDTLARQALEAGVILWVITQRPDAKDAVPGAMRDQLLDRVTFGPLSGSGAKMAFDIAGDWHRALGVAPIPGRALVWLSGAWRLVQAPWLPIPADDMRAEPLYPPRAAERRTERPRRRPAPERPDPAAQGRQDDHAAEDRTEGQAAEDHAAAYGPPPPPDPRWPGQPSSPWPPRPRPPVDPPEAAPQGGGQDAADDSEDLEYDPGQARRRRRRPTDPAP